MTAKSLWRLLGLLALSPLAQAADSKFHWPEHYQAAVSLGYDDSLDSQLDNAIPDLNKYQLKGTFYLQLSAPSIANRLPEWRAAAARGHELANHSLFHQCSHSQPGREWVKPETDLDNLSVAQMRNQVLLANTFLYAIDGKTGPRTYTAPCIDQKVGGGENYIEAIKQDFVAIRDVGSNGVVPDMLALDPAYVGVTFPANVTGAQLIAIVKAARAQGTMAVITFHGVGGDYITTSREAHAELLQFLAAHRDEYWTDTFANIMTYVRAQQH